MCDNNLIARGAVNVNVIDRKLLIVHDFHFGFFRPKILHARRAKTPLEAQKVRVFDAAVSIHN